MPFDVDAVFRAHQGEQFALHEAHLNPQLPRVLRTLGFDRTYVRGEGPWLYDDRGERYLDLLAGFGVFALGRSHPAIKAALHRAIDLDLPEHGPDRLRAAPRAARRGALRAQRRGSSSGSTSATRAPRPSSPPSSSRGPITGRSRIVYCAHAYHGLTLGALSLNGGDVVPRGVRPAARRRRRGARSATSTRCEAALADGDVGGVRRRADPGQGRLRGARAYWQRRRAGLPRRRGAVRDGRGPDRRRAHRDVLVPRAVRRRARPHLRVQGALGRLRPGRRDARARRRLPRRVLLDGPRARALDDLQAEPARDGRGARDALASSTTRASSSTRARWARCGRSGSRRSLERYELLVDVRGKGQMVGLEFGEPDEPAAAAVVAARPSGSARPSSPRRSCCPLFQRHRILTQVAADGVNIIKLLPAAHRRRGRRSTSWSPRSTTCSADAHRPGGLLSRDDRGDGEGLDAPRPAGAAAAVRRT